MKTFAEAIKNPNNWKPDLKKISKLTGEPYQTIQSRIKKMIKNKEIEIKEINLIHPLEKK